MRKKLMIGAAVISAIVLLLLPFVLGRFEVADDGSVTFVTKTEPGQANETVNKKLTKSNSKQTGQKVTTEYRPFSREEFDTSSDKTRLIFFKKPGDTASDQVHALFVSRINDFKKNIIIFHTDIDKEPDLAAELNVTRPGTVLKFDQSGVISAIYIAPQRPQLEQLRTILGI